MAAKKSQMPPAPDAGTEGAQPPEGTEAPAGASAAAPAPAASEDERIRQQADKALAQATGDQAVKLSKSEARANGLEGELKREREARKTSEQQVVELTAALAAATTAARNAGTAIPGLPDNARQLNECVTVHVLGRGGTTPRRAQVKHSDVLLVTKDDAEVDALQQELGQQATVYKVSKDTLSDLEQSGFLHAQ